MINQPSTDLNEVTVTALVFVSDLSLLMFKLFLLYLKNYTF